MNLIIRSLICILILGSLNTQAQEKIWSPIADNNWHNANHWDPAGVPTASDDLRIDDPAGPIISGDDAHSGALRVAVDGNTWMLVNDGRTLSSSEALLAEESGSSVWVILNETATWNIGAGLTVAADGDALLTVSDGSTVSSDWTRVGANSGGDGQIDISGTDTAFTTGTLHLGRLGLGIFNLTEGATAVTGTTHLGWAIGGSGHASIANSPWTVNGALVVGDQGAGNLLVEDSATVSSNAAAIGASESGEGDVSVIGTDSAWTINGDLSAGITGTARLSIGNGATVSNNAGFIGRFAGAVAEVSVSGAGSEWHNNGNLTIGNYGEGTLTIAAGAAVTNHLTSIGNEPDSIGQVVVSGSGSTWTSTSDLNIGNQGTGTLTISADATVESNGFVRIADQPGASGLLQVDGELSAAMPVIVNVDGRIRGSGQINGEVRINDGGALEPGVGPGTLAIAGDLVIQTDAILDYELDTPGVVGAGTNDLIEVDGDLTLNGTLEISDLGGLAIGTYTLITYTGALTDNGLNVASLPGGLSADIDSSNPGEILLQVGPASDGIFFDRFENAR